MPESGPAESARPAPIRPALARSVVELVVVHGMGRQKPSETLLEWAEALLRRIDWIATGGDSENAGYGTGPFSAEASARVLAANRILAAADAERPDVDDDSLDDEDVLAELRFLMAGEGIDSIEVSGLVISLLEEPERLASPPFPDGDARTITLGDAIPAPPARAVPELPGAALPVASLPVASPAPESRRARRNLESPGTSSDPADDPLPRPTAIEYNDVELSAGEPDAVEVTIGFEDAAGRQRVVSLRITEARWSEAVPPLTRGQVFAWGLAFSWRAIVRAATHFGQVWTNPARGSKKAGRVVLARIASLLTWAGAMLVGALLTVFLVVTGPLLVLPFVKRLAQAAIDNLFDYVGDAAVWGLHPVRAAGMRRVVRESVRAAEEHLQSRRESMSGDVLTSLVVLAHSEGAAICADELFSLTTGEENTLVDAFVSVGAAVTLLGSSGWNLAGAPATAAPFGETLPQNLTRAWRRSRSRAGQSPTRWLNFWGIWDPVPAGPISTGDAARARRWQASYQKDGTAPTAAADIGPAEFPVHNTASPVTDHQSYASNVHQVVDPIARLLIGVDTAEARSVADAAELFRRTGLQVRAVRALGLHRLLVIAIVLLGLGIDVQWTTTATWTGPGSTELYGFVKKVLATLFLADPGEGFFGWVVGFEWFPRLLLFGGVAVTALISNEFLASRYLARIRWWRLDRPVPANWTAGVVLRIVLAATIVVQVMVLLGPLLRRSQVGGIIIAVALLVAAGAIVVSPRWGRLPGPVRQNPGGGAT